IPLPSLDSIESADCIVKRVGDREFIRDESGAIYKDLSADVVRGLLWVSESGKEYVVVWLFDLPGHSYMSFCKNGDSHYTDIPLVFDDYAFHKFDGLSDMVLRGTRLYVSTSRRFVRAFDLSGPQGFFKDITGQTPFPMLSHHDYASILALRLQHHQERFCWLRVIHPVGPGSASTRRILMYKTQITPATRLLRYILLVVRLCFLTWVSLCLLTRPLVSNLTPSISPVTFVPAIAHLATLTSVCTIFQPSPSIAITILTRWISWMLDGFS
ncbi:unnamed protein product, partial [Brassica oleracea var. botrytis]